RLGARGRRCSKQPWIRYASSKSRMTLRRAIGLRPMSRHDKCTQTTGQSPRATDGHARIPVQRVRLCRGVTLLVEVTYGREGAIRCTADSAQPRRVLLDLYHLTFHSHAATSGHCETHEEAEVLQHRHNLSLVMIV